MHPAPVKVPDLWLVLILAAVLVLGCAAGYLFGAQHPMDWQPLEETETAKTEEIKANLLDLGFPEVILNDLAEEDLAACAGGPAGGCGERGLQPHPGTRESLCRQAPAYHRHRRADTR